MNRFHVFQFFSLLLTSLVALYLFGTRGHSTEPLSEDRGRLNSTGHRWNMLNCVYMCWFIMFVVDILRRIHQAKNDMEFVEDINNERITDLEDVEKRSPKLAKLQLKTRIPLWDLKDNKSAKVIKADQNCDKISAAKSERFKKAKKRSTVKPYDLDFSPGML